MKDYFDREVKVEVGFLSSLSAYFEEKFEEKAIDETNDQEICLLADINMYLKPEREKEFGKEIK